MKEEVKIWWEQAKRDLLSAEHALQSEDYYQVAYLAHQTVEKALKALLLDRKGGFSKGHDLPYYAKQLDVPSSIMSACEQLNPVYLKSRYPDVAGTSPFELFSRSDAIKAVTAAKEVIEWAKHLFK
ncbi:HEPN domain-containing protein [Candidatus Woesearchaeota archaeon]|nr:HEPN domain-containing protein [Candidatus Woesearchaeota archaeon]